MYIFLTMEKVITILGNLGIDITMFTAYEQSVVFMLCNIFYIITNFVLIYFAYRFILKLFRFIF